jgi:Pterin 4 alpha carbinolamine dehydratase
VLLLNLRTAPCPRLPARRVPRQALGASGRALTLSLIDEMRFMLPAGTADGRNSMISVLAEAEFHHPYISFGWGYATVSLRAKKIKGLHENDFIMAVKLDQLAGKIAVADQ